MHGPESRLGVYKTLADVPDRYKLETFASEYDGRDVWQEYLESHLFDRVKSEEQRKHRRRTGYRWKRFMDGRGRHHALASPDDAEAWGESLLNDLAIRTACDYWEPIELFYRWLMTHTDHPHRYNPFLMAANESPASREIWEFKIEGKQR